MAKIERINILGVEYSAVNLPAVIRQMGEWISSRERNYITLCGAHGVVESNRDPSYREVVNRAGIVTFDGMPVTWLAWSRGYKQEVDRVYAPDLMLEAFAQSPARGWRHFFYGGNEGIAELLKQKMQERFAKLEVVGTFCPPFRPLTQLEDADVIERINGSKPDVVWVGIGAPKQDRWMAEHLGRIEAPVMIGVGAGFDFLAGVKAWAPRWIQRSGLEWLFRLACEPRRLAPRYLSTNPRFIGLIIRQLLRRQALPTD